MSLNINNLMEFQQQFEHLKEMVAQLGGLSDQKENSEIRKKINTQISLLASTTIFPAILKQFLEEFQQKITSTFTTVEMNKLSKDLENIRQLTIPKLSSSSSSSIEEESKLVKEEPKLVYKKKTIEQIPRPVLLHILEFAFSTKANLPSVSSQWNNLIEEPRFGHMAIKEFEMIGIDPSKPPKKAFIERLEEDVKIYEELCVKCLEEDVKNYEERCVELLEEDVKNYEELCLKNYEELCVKSELFPKIPKNLSPLEKYRYCRNSKELKKMMCDIFLKHHHSWIKQNYLNEQLSTADLHSRAYAILDLHSPLSYRIFDHLAMYPPEIQKKLVKRVRVEGAEDLSNFKNDIDCCIWNLLPATYHPPTLDQLNERVQRNISAIMLIQMKREEVKKFYHTEIECRELFRRKFTHGIERTFLNVETAIQYAPLLKTFLDTYSNLPIDKEANKNFIERARKLGLKDIVELLERHLNPIFLD